MGGDPGPVQRLHRHPHAHRHACTERSSVALLAHVRDYCCCFGARGGGRGGGGGKCLYLVLLPTLSLSPSWRGGSDGSESAEVENKAAGEGGESVRVHLPAGKTCCIRGCSVRHGFSILGASFKPWHRKAEKKKNNKKKLLACQNAAGSGCGLICHKLMGKSVPWERVAA